MGLGTSGGQGRRNLTSPCKTPTAHAAKAALQTLREGAIYYSTSPLTQSPPSCIPKRQYPAVFLIQFIIGPFHPSQQMPLLLRLLTDRFTSRPQRCRLPGLRVSIPLLSHSARCGEGEGKARGDSKVTGEAEGLPGVQGHPRPHRGHAHPQPGAVEPGDG